MKCDIAVVGSGLSALVATRHLQRAGRNPVLIWPGLSSLYFLYATVDVLGYADPTTAEPVEEPIAGVQRLIADNPDHPYARAGLASLQAGSALVVFGIAFAAPTTANLRNDTDPEAKPMKLLQTQTRARRTTYSQLFPSRRRPPLAQA